MSSTTAWWRGMPQRRPAASRCPAMIELAIDKAGRANQHEVAPSQSSEGLHHTG